MYLQQSRNPGEIWRKTYNLRMHRSFVASFAIVLGMSFVARFITLRSSGLTETKLTQLEALQVEIIKRMKLPETKLLPPVQKLEVDTSVPEEITTPIVAVPEKNLRRNNESVKLNLRDVSADLLNRSALNDLDRLTVNHGRNSAFDTSPDLNTKIDVGRLDVRSASIDLDVDGANTSRIAAANIDVPEVSITEAAAQPYSLQERGQLDTGDDDLLQADVSVVLTSKDVNIDIDEYPLWNRINAEFDRWDKGRYGALHNMLKKKGRSIIATLGFADGTSQKIIWNRGTTKILVQGRSKRNRIEELKQTISALTRLNINQIRS